MESSFTESKGALHIQQGLFTLRQIFSKERN
nr:MAG TPA: hypothetical protein [Caudoviricetes sp.]